MSSPKRTKRSAEAPPRTAANDADEGDAAITFFAIGDWGRPTPELRQVARAMDHQARATPPAFILALGDNFYPGGVSSVRDKKFATSWQDVFLRYESLRVPWKVVLGNHDYQSDPQAQVDFTLDERNPHGLWQMPARNYQFAYDSKGRQCSASVPPPAPSPASLPTEAGGECTGDEGDDKDHGGSGRGHARDQDTLLELFALDSCGVQGHVRRQHPQAEQQLFRNKRWLSGALALSRARWKIVFAHHPMYTKSRCHGKIGDCLREPTVIDRNGRPKNYGMKQVMESHGVVAYISGHEHLLQHTHVAGVDYIVAGSSGADGVRLYGGDDPKRHMDWLDESCSKFGFLVCEVTSTYFSFSFVDHEGVVLTSVKRHLQENVSKPNARSTKDSTEGSGSNAETS